MISIIAAMSPNRAIGYQGKLPWHIPEDLAHFKELTMGHTIVMGRKTFESLPHGALPCRRNIVLSRTAKSIPGCEVFRSLKDLRNSPLWSRMSPLCDDKEPSLSRMSPLCDDKEPSLSRMSPLCGDEELFVIGGASVYAEVLPVADKLYITLVDENPESADTFFPEFDHSQWREIKKEKHPGFSFVELEKNQSTSSESSDCPSSGAVTSSIGS